MARNSENIAGAISAVNGIVNAQTEALAQIKSSLEEKTAGASDISLGLTGAAVGDIVKVKAVDANGKPTQWEAANLSGGKQWTKIIDTEITESTLLFEATDLENCTEFVFFWSQLLSSGDDPSCGFYVNNIEVVSHKLLGAAKQGGRVTYGYTIAKFNGLLWQLYKSSDIGTTSQDFWRMTTTPIVPYMVNRGANEAATSIKIVFFSSSPIISGKLEVYAR